VLSLLKQSATRVTKMTMTHGADETPEDVVVLTSEHTWTQATAPAPSPNRVRRSSREVARPGHTVQILTARKSTIPGQVAVRSARLWPLWTV